MQYLKIRKSSSSFMGIQKQKSCFSCYSSHILGIFYKKEGVSWTYDTPSCRLWDHLKTNHMQLIAAYMQLVTPSEVAMAVRMLMAI